MSWEFMCAFLERVYDSVWDTVNTIGGSNVAVTASIIPAVANITTAVTLTPLLLLLILFPLLL